MTRTGQGRRGRSTPDFVLALHCAVFDGQPMAFGTCVEYGHTETVYLFRRDAGG